MLILGEKVFTGLAENLCSVRLILIINVFAIDAV